MVFCKRCGNELQSQDAVTCPHCGKLIKETTSPSETTPTKRPCSVWYLLPIFFSIVGGLIMYFVLKDQNKSMAKKGLVIGITMSVIGFIIYGISYGVMMSSMSRFY